MISWLMLTLYLAAAVHRLLAAREDGVCMSCHLADSMAQASAYPPIGNNKCIEEQSAVDPIRTAFNCGHPP